MFGIRKHLVEDSIFYEYGKAGFSSALCGDTSILKMKEIEFFAFLDFFRLTLE